ncbi:MAG: PHP-associated domain-containing protein, partial [Methanomassiliicoccales archaeon]
MMSRADVHIHTKHSGIGRLGFLRFPESVSDPQDVVKNAHSMGLSVICITDHNAISGALEARRYAEDYPGLEVVVGEEISTSEGEVIGLFLEEFIPPGMSAEETIIRIREQGGLVIAPHPFSLHCPALGDRIDHLDIDAIEVLNAGHIDGFANTKAAQWGSSGRWAQVGGSDSHTLSTLADAYTLFEGKTAEDLRRSILEKSTHVKGGSWRLEKVISWSVGVVLASDVLMLKSIFGLIREADMHDPIVSKIDVLRPGKKLMALIGSIIYLIPPIPYICGITGRFHLKKLAKLEQAARRK